MEFVLKKIYSTADRMECIYTEWLTGDRAWELQVCTITRSRTIDQFTFRMLFPMAQLFSALFFHLTIHISPKSGTVKHTRFQSAWPTFRLTFAERAQQIHTSSLLYSPYLNFSTQTSVCVVYLQIASSMRLFQSLSSLSKRLLTLGG